MPSKGRTAARGYGGTHRRARAVVLERDGGVCQWCGAPATEADHLEDGKAPDPSRMVASCKACNAARGARKGAELVRAARPSRRW